MPLKTLGPIGPRAVGERVNAANENSAKDKIMLCCAWISREKAFMRLYDIFGGKVGSATLPFLMFLG